MSQAPQLFPKIYEDNSGRYEKSSLPADRTALTQLDVFVIFPRKTSIYYAAIRYPSAFPIVIS